MPPQTDWEKWVKQNNKEVAAHLETMISYYPAVNASPEDNANHPGLWKLMLEVLWAVNEYKPFVEEEE